MKNENLQHTTSEETGLNKKREAGMREREETLSQIIGGENEVKKETLINHLQAVQNDVRGEIKQRINQRDSFAIQYLVSVGAVIAGVMASNLTWGIYFLLVVPLLAIFYTTQILYSYSMTDKISKYIIEKLDRPLEKLLGTDEWESYSWRIKQTSKTRSTGIRKDFFRGSMWVVTLISLGVVLAYLSINNMWEFWNISLFTFAAAITLFLCLKIEISLYRKKDFYIFKKNKK